MKVYFEDGPLRSRTSIQKELSVSSADFIHILNAGEGPTRCMETMDWLLFNKGEHLVYTNSLEVFHNPYVWNQSLKIPEAYIRADEDRRFVRIDKFTNRELKEGHNLRRFYIAGKFATTPEELVRLKHRNLGEEKIDKHEGARYQLMP